MQALWFSGGKDSLACLYLLKEQWADLAVLWANTGKNFPEVLETIEKVRTLVPHFVEIATDRDAQNDLHGLPSQLVAIRATRYGAFATGKLARVLVQPYLDCCGMNISVPLFGWCKANGVNTIYRGQRADEDHKSPAAGGTEVEGIRFLHPLENWTAEQVRSYLVDQMEVLPGHLQFEHSSMDCYDCTAYLEKTGDIRAYMKEKHPQLYGAFKRRFDLLRSTIEEEVAHFDNASSQEDEHHAGIKQ
ncbi:MAG: phosphoadenosine phosphosulfate reductase family protein [Betaproteobacteria bacterium]|nr:phosphoadenosine phosphosulfate reductase family protein [Betaproteobacteria bacterium]